MVMNSTVESSPVSSFSGNKVEKLAKPPSSLSEAAVPIMEKQVSEAPKPVLAKTSGSVYATALKNLPHSLESLNELCGLSAALSKFSRKFSELQRHLVSIDESIDNVSKALKNKEPEVLAVVPVPNASTSSAPGATVLSSADQAIGSSANDESSRSVEEICQVMSGRMLRKYITLHLSDIEKLREEVTAALKHAPNAARLVFLCVGRFYLQGSKIYSKLSRDSPMVTSRQAALLILEFFLLSGCTSVKSSVQNEAKVAAISWRKRLINEGGVSNASNPDARGLLLFIAAYGIPSVFGNQDLMKLILISNIREVSDALRQSPFLVKRIPDVVGEMVKQRMFEVAADVAYSFGVEGKFSPEIILTSFLEDSKETCAEAKRESQGSPLAMKEANLKQLAALRTVAKCLEEYKIDPAKFAGWSINVKIANLEEDNSELDRKIGEREILKRKADWQSFRTLEMKQPRMSNGVSPSMHSSFTQSHEQRAFDPNDGRTFYDGGHSGQLNGYSGVSSLIGASILGAAGAGALQRFPGNTAGASVGYAAGAGGVYPQDHGPESFMSNGGGALNESSLRHDFMGPPALPGKGASTLEQGFPGQASTVAGFGNRDVGADLYQFADAVLERELVKNSSRTGGYSYMSPAAGHFQR